MPPQYYRYSHQRPPHPNRRPPQAPNTTTTTTTTTNRPTQQVTQTATIRNAVNLRKDTLKVTPMVGDPTTTKLVISFSFDASAPCAVGTYVAATEIPSRGCALVPKHQTPAALVMYSKGVGFCFFILRKGRGSLLYQPLTAHSHYYLTISPSLLIRMQMNQLFPPSTEDGIPYVTEVQHVIDVSLHTEAELCSSNNNNSSTTSATTSARESTYPLIIRLESITEEGCKAGHTLEELKPGGDQASWIQSQTTFAELHKEDEHYGTTNTNTTSSNGGGGGGVGGGYVVRILKQKIWVQGTSYELQEIYGLQQGPRNSKTSMNTNPNGTGTGTATNNSVNEDEERLCVICLVNDRDTTVLPCRHMCMCHECAQELRKQTSKCPICRKEVESLLHIKLNRSGAGVGGGGNNNNNSSSSRRAAAAAAAAT